MALHRLIQHLKTQNWTAVALDFVIVVLGVFIGLQVSNWNTARRDRVSAERYLVGLVADMRADESGLEDVMNADVQRISAVNYVLAKARGEAPAFVVKIPYQDQDLGGDALSVDPALVGEPPLAARDTLWAIVNFTRTTEPSTDTFDTLVSTGDLGLLSRAAPVDMLVDYHASIESIADFETNTLRPMRLIWAEKGMRVGLSVLGAVPEAKLVALARADDEFAAVLRSAREASIGHYGMAKSVHDEAATILAMIAKHTDSATTGSE